MTTITIKAVGNSSPRFHLLRPKTMNPRTLNIVYELVSRHRTSKAANEAGLKLHKREVSATINAVFVVLDTHTGEQKYVV